MDLKIFSLILLLFGFRIQASMSHYYNNGESGLRTPNSDFSTDVRNRYKYTSDASRNTQPTDEYGFETVQKLSAYIPRNHKGPPIRIIPENEKTDYYFVHTNKSTFNIPKLPNPPANYQSFLTNQNYSTNIHRSSSHNHAHRRHNNHHHRNNNNNGSIDCIKCPNEKILIAQKGLDGVLIEPPKLFSCNNRPILNTAYQIETLFGSKFQFLLPHGTHSFHGKIRNKKTGKFIQNCLLRYKVIVQQCGRFFPHDLNVRIRCDPGFIWGSKCHFNCRKGYINKLSSNMVCGDNLQWEGEEPECLSEPPIDEKKSCDFLTMPENGKFSCEYPNNINPKEYENDLTTPNGSVCRIKCNRNYEIPKHLQPYSTIICYNSQWNTTYMNICQPKTRRYNQYV